jgi:arabinose-5-phosphate isomerase
MSAVPDAAAESRPRAAGAGIDAAAALELAARTLDIEAAALARARSRLGAGFVRACELMLACRGRVVVTGIGKSGHVARKIAATLASTGTPAFFLHPAEASHGDLGMITAADVVLALSNSGESEEITALAPHIKRLAAPLVVVTGRPDSTLARHADAVVDASVEAEACPLNLAPTASTTAQLALGDALAVVLLDARGFGHADFARSHPGGALGRKLLTHVRDVMRTGDAVPRVAPQAPLREVLLEMTRAGLGMTAVVDADGRPLGVFTDGDLRRLWEREADTRHLLARDVMHPRPRVIGVDALAAEAAALMEQHRISSLLVVDADGRLAGAFNAHDLMRHKVI